MAPRVPTTARRRRSGRWLRHVGVRGGCRLPWLLPLVCCATTLTLWTTLALLIVMRFPLSGGGLFVEYLKHVRDEWRAVFLALAIVSLAAALLLHRFRGRSRPQFTGPQRWLGVAADAVIAMAFAITIWFGFLVRADLIEWGGLLRTERKLSIDLPTSAGRVGVPPDDGRDVIVVVIDADAERQASFEVAGAPVPATRSGIAQGIAAELRRLRGSSASVRIRLEAAPDVRLQDVVIAIDATRRLGFRKTWFAGVP